jgi:hypothetical protein
VLCHENIEETIEHLFFDCSSAITRWFANGINWDESSNIHQKIYLAKKGFSLLFLHGGLYDQCMDHLEIEK